MSTKPTAHSLPHNAVIAHTLKTRRLVTRLSKSSLITLALRWLDQKLCRDFAPDWTDPDDDEYDEDGTVEHSLDEILALYEELGSVARFRAKDVSERMFAWEWRNGFTLLGIAELEWQCMSFSSILLSSHCL
jgi:central kinetochore subunit Mis15/CHL4